MQSIAKILDAKNKAPINLRHQTLPSRKQPISCKSIINCPKKKIYFHTAKKYFIYFNISLSNTLYIISLTLPHHLLK